MHALDVLIVGGGLAGASLAVALRNTRLRVGLVERLPPRCAEGWDARVYAISPASAAFLDAIGAWRHLDHARLSPLRAMAVAGDAGGQLNFSAYEAGVPELGWIAESSLLALELWEGAKRQANLTTFLGRTPLGLAVDEQGAAVTLDDGTRLSAQLVVAADGRDSWVRQQAGLLAEHLPYGERGVVANFETAHPHQATAWQWFRDDGVLALLPLPGNRVSMVWSTEDAHAEALCRLPPDALCATVAHAAGGVLGDLSLLTPPQAFPLQLLRVPSVVAPRVALIGDAAHGIHPLSGHGVNLGLLDAKALSEVLAAAPAWQDIGHLSLLRRYQRARREEVVLMQAVTDGLRRLFRATVPGVAPLRNAGLTFTDRLPLLKNALVRYALGGI